MSETATLEPRTAFIDSELDVRQLQTPRAALRYQLELIERRDVVLLRQCFVLPLRKQLTRDAVEAAAGWLEGLVPDDLSPAIYHGRTGSRIWARAQFLTTFEWRSDRWLTCGLWCIADFEEVTEGTNADLCEQQINRRFWALNDTPELSCRQLYLAR